MLTLPNKCGGTFATGLFDGWFEVPEGIPIPEGMLYAWASLSGYICVARSDGLVMRTPLTKQYYTPVRIANPMDETDKSTRLINTPGIERRLNWRDDFKVWKDQHLAAYGTLEAAMAVLSGTAIRFE